ncbi:MAG: hypothetical protein LBK97_01370 [Prevotellaceae bacterium]|jgi:hypothetical protein|nr:hypothetical protein [Prevotellaceae bacterium]
MNTSIYNICKVTVLLFAVNIPLFSAGQLKPAGQQVVNSVVADTAVSESTVKKPDLQTGSIVEGVFPAIPVSIPGVVRPSMLPPWYMGYEDAKSLLHYTAPRFEAWRLNLNLNLPPQKSVLDIIGENPLRALIYGMATLAGMANNTVMGEDKMNKIRLDVMVQSRSAIPETAISGNGRVYYEIDIRRNRGISK